MKIFHFLYFLYAAIIFLCFLLVTCVCILPFLFISKEHRQCSAYYLFHYFFKIQFLFLGIRIIRQGDWKNVPKQCVFVSNHLSYLDAFIVTASINQIFRPLGKKGITTIPVIGFLYQQYVILVDRKSMQSKKESLKEMKATLGKGNSILLFPEGTFYENVTKRLNEFKDGAFHLAIENKVDVQPIILYFTRERLNPQSVFSLNPGKVIIQLLPAVSTKNYDILQAINLKERIVESMRQQLEKNNYPIINT